MRTTTTFFTLAAAVMLAFGSDAMAQVGAPVGPGSAKLGKVEPSVVKTPEYQITGGQNKRYKLREWLEIEFDYATVPEEIDELTFKVYIEIEKKLLDGEVTYINIPKDREHWGVVYVAPKTLEKLTGGKALTANSIENVWVTVLHQGQEIDKPIAFKPGSGPVPNLPHLTGLVLTKDQTPFAPLYYDRYETMKPAAR